MTLKRLRDVLISQGHQIRFDCDIQHVCKLIGINTFSLIRSINTPGEVELKFPHIHFYSLRKINRLKLLHRYLKSEMPFVMWHINTLPCKIKLCEETK